MSIELLPRELLIETFRCLNHKELIACSKVCKFWKQTSELDTLWKSSIEQKWGIFQKDMESLSQKKIFSHLTFFSNLNQKKFERKKARKYGAPFLDNDEYGFSVVSSNIQILNKKTNETYLLKNPQPETSSWIYFSLEKDFFFAIDKTCRIFQWNYQTKKLIQLIEPENRDDFAHTEITKENVLIKDGMIFINYAPYVQIISYNFPEKKRIIKYDDYGLCHEIHKEDTTLYIQKKNKLLFLDLSSENLTFQSWNFAKDSEKDSIKVAFSKEMIVILNYHHKNLHLAINIFNANSKAYLGKAHVQLRSHSRKFFISQIALKNSHLFCLASCLFPFSKWVEKLLVIDLGPALLPKGILSVSIRDYKVYKSPFVDDKINPSSFKKLIEIIAELEKKLLNKELSQQSK